MGKERSVKFGPGICGVFGEWPPVRKKGSCIMASVPFSMVGSGGEPSDVDGLSNCPRFRGFVCDIEPRTQLVLAFRTEFEINTSLCSRGHNFVGKCSLLEGPPFEILLVSTASHTAFMALLTGRLGFVTLKPFCFTCYTTYNFVSKVSTFR